MAEAPLPKDCYKILSRWAKCESYVYIRPLTSKMVDASKDHRLYWTVTVEYRTMPPGSWRAEGYHLADVIRELDESVPKARGGKRIDWRAAPGLNAPKAAQKRAQKRSRKAREGSAPKKAKIDKKKAKKR